MAPRRRQPCRALFRGLFRGLISAGTCRIVPARTLRHPSYTRRRRHGRGIPWTGCVDTDLSFSEFFNGDLTMSLRFETAVPERGYEGPCVAENGTGTFALGQGSYFKHPEGSSLGPALPQMYFAVGAIVESADQGLHGGPNRWYRLAPWVEVAADASYFDLYRQGEWMGQLGANTHGTPGDALPARSASGSGRPGKR